MSSETAAASIRPVIARYALAITASSVDKPDFEARLADRQRRATASLFVLNSDDNGPDSSNCGPSVR
jgi:hypothetical protein